VLGFQTNVIHYNSSWRPFDNRPVIPAASYKHYFIARGVQVQGLDDNVNIPRNAVLVRGLDLNRAMTQMMKCQPSFELTYCIATRRGIVVEKGAQAPLYAIDTKDFQLLKECDSSILIAKPDL
jgi:hypothetical protein